jgi:hypothetical protein
MTAGVVGAGRRRASTAHRWTAVDVFAAADEQRPKRRWPLARTIQRRLIVATATGNVDVDHRGMLGGEVHSGCWRSEPCP